MKGISQSSIAPHHPFTIYAGFTKLWLLNIMKSIHVCIFSFASSPSQFQIRSSNCLRSILCKSLPCRALPYPSVSSLSLQTFAETQGHSFKIVFSSWLFNASITETLCIFTPHSPQVPKWRKLLVVTPQTALPASVGTCPLCPWLLSRGLLHMHNSWSSPI